MFCINKGCESSLLMYFGDDMEGEGGLPGGFWAVYLYDAPSWQPPTPKATSNASEPVEITSMAWSPRSSSFITVPLPYSFSSFCSVACKSFCFSSGRAGFLSDAIPLPKV